MPEISGVVRLLKRGFSPLGARRIVELGCFCIRLSLLIIEVYLARSTSSRSWGSAPLPARQCHQLKTYGTGTVPDSEYSKRYIFLS